MTRTKPRTFAHLVDLFPGSQTQLVQALGTNRHTLWELRRGEHRKVPHDLLALLAAVLERGTADGSPAPTREELTAAWMAAFRGRQ